MSRAIGNVKGYWQETFPAVSLPLMLRPRLHCILERFALLCFHRSPVDVEALNAHIDNVAGHDP